MSEPDGTNLRYCDNCRMDIDLNNEDECAEHADECRPPELNERIGQL
jgi:hypothetical protein